MTDIRKVNGIYPNCGNPSHWSNADHDSVHANCAISALPPKLDQCDRVVGCDRHQRLTGSGGGAENQIGPGDNLDKRLVLGGVRGSPRAVAHSTNCP